MSGSDKVFELPLRIPWDLHGFERQAFEDRIASHLRTLFRRQRDTVRVRQTVGHDGGRDVVIEAHTAIRLFGIHIPTPANPPVRIHVECKWTKAERLSPSFTEDFAQFGDDPPAYYFLVTNATITPTNHWNAVQACRNRVKPVQFKLVDRPLLLAHLQRANDVFGKVRPVVLPSGVGFEYLCDKRHYGSENVITVHFVVRNLTEKPSHFELSLATDASWDLQPDHVEVVLEPFGAEVFKLQSKRVLADEFGDLELRASVDRGSASIQIGTRGLTFSFEPEICGSKHLKMIAELTDVIDAVAPVSFLSISGAAGVGKSRVVDEMIKRRGMAIRYARTYFEPANDVAAFQRLFTNMKLKRRFDSASRYLDYLIDSFVPSGSDEHVIIMEDLHHASKDVIAALRARVAKANRRDLPIRFILTGRNDYSFPNEEYFALLHLLAIPPVSHDRAFELEPFTDDETKVMIRTTIDGAPPGVVDRIHKLSENIPFYVTQVIEYLLEVKLVELRTKHTVGLTKGERFFSKRELPPTIEQVYELRYRALQRARFGKFATDVLTCASFFGLVVDPDIVENLIPDVSQRQETLDLLRRRRFLRNHPLDESHVFSHENLLHFLRRRARSDAHRLRAARLVLRTPGVLAKLRAFDRAEVYRLADRAREAMKLFAPMVQRIERVDNFSSEDLDVRWFHYLDAVFEAGLATGYNAEVLCKLLLSKSYMGIHNNPLMVGFEACNEALRQLDRLPLNGDEKAIARAKIRQMQAHGLQNMGRTDHARGIMLELDAQVRTDARLAGEEDFLFDLYDRQHALFIKMNHLSVARSFCDLAKRAAKCNGKLLTCHMITETATDLLREPALSRDRAIRTHETAVRFGAHRLQVFTRLSMCVAEFLCNLDRRKHWQKLLDTAMEILEQAAIENLSDSLMRSQLLVGTLIYLLHGRDARKADLALRHVESGINDSIRFGNGLFIWLFYNLGAVIRCSLERHPDEISRYFDTAIEQLDRQSLLFLGNHDVCYPNTFVISNAIRYEKSEQKAYRLLARVRYYEDEYAPDRVVEDHRPLMSALRRNHILFHKRKEFVVPFDPITTFWGARDVVFTTR